MMSSKPHSPTRRKVIDAFERLLGERLYSQITPTQIIAASGVARSTFYRNYDSVRDVLLDYFDYLYDAFGEEAPPVNFEDEAYLTHIFRFYRSHATEFRNILLSDLSETWLDSIINYHLDQRGEMPSGSLEKYWLYYYAGAVYCSVRQWLLDGTPGTPEEMGALLASRSFV